MLTRHFSSKLFALALAPPTVCLRHARYISQLSGASARTSHSLANGKVTSTQTYVQPGFPVPPSAHDSASTFGDTLPSRSESAYTRLTFNPHSRVSPMPGHTYSVDPRTGTVDRIDNTSFFRTTRVPYPTQPPLQHLFQPTSDKPGVSNTETAINTPNTIVSHISAELCKPETNRIPQSVLPVTLSTSDTACLKNPVSHIASPRPIETSQQSKSMPVNSSGAVEKHLPLVLHSNDSTPKLYRDRQVSAYSIRPQLSSGQERDAGLIDAAKSNADLLETKSASRDSHLPDSVQPFQKDSANVLDYVLPLRVISPSPADFDLPQSMSLASQWQPINIPPANYSFSSDESHSANPNKMRLSAPSPCDVRTASVTRAAMIPGSATSEASIVDRAFDDVDTQSMTWHQRAAQSWGERSSAARLDITAQLNPAEASSVVSDGQSLPGSVGGFKHSVAGDGDISTGVCEFIDSGDSEVDLESYKAAVSAYEHRSLYSTKSTNTSLIPLAAAVVSSQTHSSVLNPTNQMVSANSHIDFMFDPLVEHDRAERAHCISQALSHEYDQVQADCDSLLAEHSEREANRDVFYAPQTPAVTTNLPPVSFSLNVPLPRISSGTDAMLKTASVACISEFPAIHVPAKTQSCSSKDDAHASLVSTETEAQWHAVRHWLNCDAVSRACAESPEAALAFAELSRESDGEMHNIKDTTLSVTPYVTDYISALPASACTDDISAHLEHAELAALSRLSDCNPPLVSYLADQTHTLVPQPVGLQWDTRNIKWPAPTSEHETGVYPVPPRSGSEPEPMSPKPAKRIESPRARYTDVSAVSVKEPIDATKQRKRYTDMYALPVFEPIEAGTTLRTRIMDWSAMSVMEPLHDDYEPTSLVPHPPRLPSEFITPPTPLVNTSDLGLIASSASDNECVADPVAINTELEKAELAALRRLSDCDAPPSPTVALRTCDMTVPDIANPVLELSADHTKLGNDNITAVSLTNPDSQSRLCDTSASTVTPLIKRVTPSLRDIVRERPATAPTVTNSRDITTGARVVFSNSVNSEPTISTHTTKLPTSITPATTNSPPHSETEDTLLVIQPPPTFSLRIFSRLARSLYWRRTHADYHQNPRYANANVMNTIDQSEKEALRQRLLLKHVRAGYASAQSYLWHAPEVDNMGAEYYGITSGAGDMVIQRPDQNHLQNSVTQNEQTVSVSLGNDAFQSPFTDDNSVFDLPVAPWSESLPMSDTIDPSANLMQSLAHDIRFDRRLRRSVYAKQQKLAADRI